MSRARLQGVRRWHTEKSESDNQSTPGTPGVPLSSTSCYYPPPQFDVNEVPLEELLADPQFSKQALNSNQHEDSPTYYVAEEDDYALYVFEGY